jgi:hypothetical protein
MEKRKREKAFVYMEQTGKKERAVINSFFTSFKVEVDPLTIWRLHEEMPK